MALDLESLLAQLQQQYGAANQAGLDRYQNLMRGINVAGSNIAGTYNRAMSGLDTAGQSAKADVARNTTRNLASSSQDLMSRGLGNTTITATNARGINEDAARTNASIDENVAGQKSNLELSRANSQLGVANLWANGVLSRNDQGPDAGLYANLIQSLAANGGMNGQGGGGGGSGGRSYNFVGGVPRGGNSNINFGSVGGGEPAGGVQTFTNPNAQSGQTITQSGYPRPGTAAFANLGLSQQVQARQFWQNQGIA